MASTEGDRKRPEVEQTKLNAALQKMQEELKGATRPIETMKNGRDFSDKIGLLT